MNRGLLVAVLALATAHCAPRVESDYDRLPVLMVHGLGDSGSRTYADLMGQLERLGWPREYLLAPDLTPADDANAAAAERQLRDAADSLLAHASRASGDRGRSPTRILVVGHSMGALSARWFVARVAPEEVAALITLAGANHGTNAFCDRNAPGPDDMCPAFARSRAESEIQVELNGTAVEPRDETPFGVGTDSPGRPSIAPDSLRHIRYVSLSAGSERWIIPARSALLDGAEHHTLTGTDHDAIAHDPRVARMLDEVERQAR